MQVTGYRFQVAGCRVQGAGGNRVLIKTVSGSSFKAIAESYETLVLYKSYTELQELIISNKCD